ncbi:hypothetical protein DM860_008402 [Cuscuta australis]|uniref:Uncharacterized protein n=1 Tax=Cuscuta australis TaxID=267555 RepID=A0A328D5L2_9ASTE|nr:hypothetical protein DM860_008402 [Cuscuta australis]
MLNRRRQYLLSSLYSPVSFFFITSLDMNLHHHHPRASPILLLVIVMLFTLNRSNYCRRVNLSVADEGEDDEESRSPAMDSPPEQLLNCSGGGGKEGRRASDRGYAVSNKVVPGGPNPLHN